MTLDESCCPNSMEPLPKKHIPESKIALNPVVIDDSKRGLPPQNNIPPDMDALLAWLKEQALEAHNSETFSRNGESIDYDSGVFAGREEMANETIAKIENSRVSQRPHLPQGWDHV